MVPTAATGNFFIAGLNNGADNTGSVGGDLMLEIGSTVLSSRDNGDLNESSISFSLPFISIASKVGDLPVVVVPDGIDMQDLVAVPSFETLGRGTSD